MNAFANSLLHLLLSWMRALFSDVLSFAQGGDGGLIAWISKHWLLLAVILLAAGILTDGMIYLIRWRPQYVWRTRFRRRFRREDDGFDEDQFQEGYDDAMQDYNFADTPIAGLSAEPEPPPAMEPYYAEPAPPQPEPDFDYSRLPGADQVPPERRRRSERHGRHPLGRFRLTDLTKKNDDLPPDARSAFHDPVYPASDMYPQEDDDSQDV